MLSTLVMNLSGLMTRLTGQMWEERILKTDFYKTNLLQLACRWHRRRRAGRQAWSSPRPGGCATPPSSWPHPASWSLCTTWRSRPLLVSHHLMILCVQMQDVRRFEIICFKMANPHLIEPVSCVEIHALPVGFEVEVLKNVHLVASSWPPLM